MKSAFARICFLTAATASLGTHALARTAPPQASIALTPAGKWEVEYDDWRCLLTRPMEANGRPGGRFWLERVPLTPTTWLKIAIEQEGGRRAGGQATVLVDGQAAADTFHYNYFHNGKLEVREFMLDWNKAGLSRASKALEFRTRNHGIVQAQVDDFPLALKALDDCMIDLATSLGIEKFDASAVAVPATIEDLPTHLLKIPEEGVQMVYLFWVRVDGRIERCKLLKPTGQPRFDSGFCPSLERSGRAKPARDAAGRAIAVPVFGDDTLRRATF